MNNKNLMTLATKQRLEKELQESKLKLANALKEIGEAAGNASDWHDNAAFDQANVDHDVNASWTRSLVAKLRNTQIIKPRQETDKIDLGNKVVILYEGAIEPETYTLLGGDDSGTKRGWISHTTPLGSMLLGRSEGEVVDVEVGGTKRKAKVLKILPGDFE